MYFVDVPESRTQQNLVFKVPFPAAHDTSYAPVQFDILSGTCAYRMQHANTNIVICCVLPEINSCAQSIAQCFSMDMAVSGFRNEVCQNSNDSLNSQVFVSKMMTGLYKF